MSIDKVVPTISGLTSSLPDPKLLKKNEKMGTSNMATLSSKVIDSINHQVNYQKS